MVFRPLFQHRFVFLWVINHRFFFFLNPSEFEVLNNKLIRTSQYMHAGKTVFFFQIFKLIKKNVDNRINCDLLPVTNGEVSVIFLQIM